MLIYFLLIIENTTSINLINLLYVLLFYPFFIMINRSGFFERYNAVSVRQI